MKKLKIPLILIIIAAVIVGLCMIFGVFGGDSVNYTESIKGWKPFNSKDIGYTVGEVLNKYMPDAEWSTRKSGNVTYVDVKGIAKGTEASTYEISQITFSFQLENNGESAKYGVDSIIAAGKTITDTNAAKMLYVIFSMFKKGYEDLYSLPVEFDLA